MQSGFLFSTEISKFTNDAEIILQSHTTNYNQDMQACGVRWEMR